MLILRSSPASPFGRKVKIAAAALGLAERIEVVAADTNDPADSLRRQNPLGKIPVLLLANGEALYDSAVIVDYLDWMAGGGKIIPASAELRFGVLTRQALADGIAEAALLQVYEGRMREPQHRSAKWMDLQAGKVARGLEAAQIQLDRFTHEDIGGIALACALGYLDLRFAGEWRTSHPRLVAWLDRFERATPSFAATRMPA
jgi:glutathione S-transferase